MTKRTRTLLAVAPLAALLVAGVVVSLPPEEVQAQQADHFAPVREALSTFDTLFVAFTTPNMSDTDPESTDWDEWFLFADGAGRVAIDNTRRRQRWYWDGQRVTYTQDRKPPMEIPGANALAAAMWNDLRSGLADATFESADPAAIGEARHPTVLAHGTWARITSPSAWAQGMEFWLDVSAVGRPNDLYLVGPQAPKGRHGKPFRVGFREFYANVAMPGDAFQPEAPARYCGVKGSSRYASEVGSGPYDGCWPAHYDAEGQPPGLAIFPTQ